jgi:uncharacterized RDD family membrane protein YckC
MQQLFSPASPAVNASAPATPAALGARIVARILDELIIIAPFVAGTLAGGAIAVVQNDVTAAALAPLCAGVLGLAGLMVYQVLLLVRTGQTLGKKWLRIKVVRLDGGQVSFGAHVLRGLVLGLLGPFTAVLLFRGERRCVHDLAAETKVVVAP